jgi:glycosyltransferase involved in cell wall biosynthesis
VPRRIGLIVYGSIDRVSGGYLYDRQLVAALQARGWDVRIFTVPRRSYARCLLDNLQSGLARRIENSDLDLLLEDELGHPSLVELNWTLRSRWKRPIVSIVHHLRTSERHTGWQRVFYRQIERAYLKSVDAFVFNSRATAESVRPLAGDQHPCVIALPAGDRFQQPIDPAAIGARAGTMPPLRIVFLGNVISRKGLDTLIDALSRLPEGSWLLTIIGDLEVDPGLTRRLRQLVRMRGLQSRIWFAGRLVDDEVAATLRRSHVIAVPSSYEGFGIAYLEAMSFGLPAIGTTDGGAREIITHGVNGWLVAPGDSKRLGEVIRLFIEDPGLLVSMSLTALGQAGRHPTWSGSMGKVATFLQDLL